MTATASRAAAGLALACLVALATVHLTRWPATWFDEGSHLHVPKTIVRYGVYADRSSEGFRYYGPTLSVGPTVMLPIAGAFAAFDVGLLQARLVMAAYLVAFVVAAWALGRHLGGRAVAALTAVLLVTSPGPATLELGRQVLGEVPGGTFLCAGLWLWFRAWTAPTAGRLFRASMLLALATITKHVFMLALGPALAVSWLLNAAYYRTVPARVFLVPGITCGLVFGAWQLVVLHFLGPGTFAENWALFREASAGAAFVIDPAVTAQAFKDVAGPRAVLGLAIPSLAYTGWRARSRCIEEQQWGIVALVAAANLAWFVVASTGWRRYAFVGMIMSVILVARLVRDTWRWVDVRAGARSPVARVARGVLACWTGGLTLIPAATIAGRLAAPPEPHAERLASWLTATVPLRQRIETWEPELGALTDHDYHYPPPSLLIKAVAAQRGTAPPAGEFYDFRAVGAPDIVVVGAFARLTGLYPDGELTPEFHLAHVEGPYAVWTRVLRTAK